MFAISNKNCQIFNGIFKVAEANGKLINNMKLTKDEIHFDIKNGDVFAICEFLDADQIMDWVSIIENVKTL